MAKRLGRQFQRKEKFWDNELEAVWAFWSGRTFDEVVAEAATEGAVTVVLRDRATSEQTEPVEYISEPTTREVQQEEAALVARYNEWLKQGLRFPEIRGGRLAASLYPDGFDEARDLLIEAKSSANRAFIRMAIGQLFDYQRFMPSLPALAVLVPSQPSDDLQDLLREHRIGLIYEEPQGRFVEDLF